MTFGSKYASSSFSVKSCSNGVLNQLHDEVDLIDQLNFCLTLPFLQRVTTVSELVSARQCHRRNRDIHIISKFFNSRRFCESGFDHRLLSSRNCEMIMSVWANTPQSVSCSEDEDCVCERKLNKVVKKPTER